MRRSTPVKSCALARALHVPANHVFGIVNEERGSHDTSAHPPELWLGLQQGYELDVARDTPAAKIEIEVLPQAS